MELELIFLFLMIGLVLTYLIHAELFFQKLAKLAPDTYSELGSPSVIGKKQNALPLLLLS